MVEYSCYISMRFFLLGQKTEMENYSMCLLKFQFNNYS